MFSYRRPTLVSPTPAAQQSQNRHRKQRAQSRRGQPRSSFRVAVQPTRTALDTIPEWSRVGRGSYGGQPPSDDHTKKVPAHPGKVRLSWAPTPSQYRVEPHPRAARRVAPTRHRHSPRTGQMTTAETSQNTEGGSRRCRHPEGADRPRVPAHRRCRRSEVAEWKKISADGPRVPAHRRCRHTEVAE